MVFLRRGVKSTLGKNRTDNYPIKTAEELIPTKFSQDATLLFDLKANPGRVEKSENNQEELSFMKAVAQGLMDIKEGNSISLSKAKKRLGIK